MCNHGNETLQHEVPHQTPYKHTIVTQIYSYREIVFTHSKCARTNIKKISCITMISRTATVDKINLH